MLCQAYASDENMALSDYSLAEHNTKSLANFSNVGIHSIALLVPKL